MEAPAHQVGLEFEPGLGTRILDNIDQAPGNLPSLEFVLAELWETRRRGQLRHETYEAMGKLQGAIAQRADETFARLTPVDQEAARRVFLQLVRPGEGTADTRRRATWAEVGDAVRPVVQVLADARLLVTGRDEATGEQTLEVVHEALIRHWRRLQSWLDQDREFLLWHQRLRGAVAEWERTEHDAGGLLRGAPLAEAERWLGERTEDLTLAERRLIQESVARREQERELQEQRRRRFTWTAVGVAGILLLLAFLAWWQRSDAINQAVLARIARLDAETERDRAEQRRKESERLRHISVAQALATQALHQHDQRKDERGALLARQAFLLNEQHQGHGLDQVDDALRTILRTPYFSRILRHEGRVLSVAFSSDGARPASGSRDGIIRIWIARTETLREMVCEKVWRNLTLDEWHRFVGVDITYEPTCPNRPLGEGVMLPAIPSR
jgi:hypothetical protein